jgi:ABC-type bacteriocin/lantibiotic exporter with double-glycine peptidase domain
MITTDTSNELNYTDIKQLDELISLFSMHNLVPKLSKHEHVFANSLAMLMTSMHWNGNIKHLFDSLSCVKDREMDLLDILNTMANLGFSNHKLKVNSGKIDERLMPCLFIPKNKQNSPPLVILGIEGKLVTAFHSLTKKKIKLQSRNLQGDIYFFETIELEKLQEQRQTEISVGITWFRSIFSKFKPVINEIIITSIFINAFSLAMPLFSMLIYNSVIATGATASLKEIIIGILMAVVTEFILRIFRLKSMIWLGVRLDNIVSNAIFERLLLMKASYTEGASISSQVSRIKAFRSIRDFFISPSFIVLVELPFTIIILMVIWWISGPLVFIPIIVMVLFAILLGYFGTKMRISNGIAARANSDVQLFTIEIFTKMQSLRRNGMSKIMGQRFKEKVAKSARANFESNLISSITENIAYMISMLSGVAIVVFGTYLMWNKTITIGALVATMILIWRVLTPLQVLCSMLPRFDQIKNTIGQINKLISIEVERQPIALKKAIKSLDGSLILTNLGLRYGIDTEPVFIGLDLEVKKGEIIAITGANGSGKSSFLKLINGLYQPQTGIINIDGINIKQMDPLELRSHIAYLPQSPNFFEGTIKENLLLANPLATDLDIQKVLEETNAIEYLKALKNGIDTMIYANNTPLPSGFIYILSLARVLLRTSSNILLLDELPNSALSGHAGTIYKKIINDARGKKTVFFISQREDYIKFADKIVSLKAGNRPSIISKGDSIKKYGL